MRKLRQLLRRPVDNCLAEIQGEPADDGTYVITTTCPHLTQPRVHHIIGSAAQDEAFRNRAFEDAQRDVDTHMRYSDPW